MIRRAAPRGAALGRISPDRAHHHTTFLVNSVAHLYGTQPYTKGNSGRDNALLSFITNGEGYHNFHHKFPSDFRNGVRWYQGDPTKWLIAFLGFAGLARHLVQTPRSVIEKTRLGILATAQAGTGGRPASSKRRHREHTRRRTGLAPACHSIARGSQVERNKRLDPGRARRTS